MIIGDMAGFFCGRPTAKVILALIALCLVPGCSSGRIPTFPVEGKVVFPDGEPARTGIVEFRSQVHPLNARGKIGRDGRFRLGTYGDIDGAVAGPHDAIVVQFFAADSTPDFKHDHGDPIDPKFADYASADLQFDISEEPNEITIEVQRQHGSR